MARERHERARVGEHSDKPAEEAVVRKRVELPLDSLFLIEEPPAAAELNFAGRFSVLKAADRGGENKIVDGIVVVDDRFRQRVFLLEQVEIFAQGFGLRPIADVVVAGVGAERLGRAGVYVAQSAEVQLLRPILFGVETAEETA